VSTFTTLLATIGDGISQQYPAGGWAHYSLTLPTDVAGRIAFRYVSPDASNADYIGIDTVSASASSGTTPVPEPDTLALAALALAGAAGITRRRKQSVSTPLPA
jgi:MYXO-CTERM domain-containing protein